MPILVNINSTNIINWNFIRKLDYNNTLKVNNIVQSLYYSFPHFIPFIPLTLNAFYYGLLFSPHSNDSHWDSLSRSNFHFNFAFPFFELSPNMIYAPPLWGRVTSIAVAISLWPMTESAIDRCNLQRINHLKRAHYNNYLFLFLIQHAIRWGNEDSVCPADWQSPADGPGLGSRGGSQLEGLAPCATQTRHHLGLFPEDGHHQEPACGCE